MLVCDVCPALVELLGSGAVVAVVACLDEEGGLYDPGQGPSPDPPCPCLLQGSILLLKLKITPAYWAGARILRLLFIVHSFVLIRRRLPWLQLTTEPAHVLHGPPAWP